MQDTYIITPHLIERWVIADEVEVAGITRPDTSEGIPGLPRALLGELASCLRPC